MTDAITEATFTELAESGYARMSMEAVARRAGVGKAALYRRWSSKQEMLCELIRTAVEDTLPPRPETGALHSDLRELPARLDMELAPDLLIAPLVFRMLIMDGESGEEYLETLTTAIEAALKAATR